MTTLRALLLCLVVAAPVLAAPAPPAPLAIGDVVPDFSVTDLQGRTRKLSDLQKESSTGIVSLTFWCSFCHSCRDMEAQLEELARARKGKVVVAAVDASAGETPQRVRDFAREKGLTLPILMDAPGATADLFGVKVTTTTVVIDADRRLRYRGQFAHGAHAFAAEALDAVAAKRPVARAETKPHG